MLRAIAFLLLSFNSMANQECASGMEKDLVAGCVCPIGTDYKYGQCVKLGLPEFAIGDGNGDWHCIEGYIKKKQKCFKVNSALQVKGIERVDVINCDKKENNSANCKSLPAAILSLTQDSNPKTTTENQSPV